jgi:hypothetical protein
MSWQRVAPSPMIRVTSRRAPPDLSRIDAEALQRLEERRIRQQPFFISGGRLKTAQYTIPSDRQRGPMYCERRRRPRPVYVSCRHP